MVTDGLTPLTLLLFLGLVLGSIVALGGALVALILKQPLWTRRLLWLEAAGLALYAALYLLASLTSHNRTLDLAQEKHICEVDCHLAYEVIGVRPAKTWEGREARGQFWIVTVRGRFDSATISARRPRNASLTPNGRTVAVVDGQGHRYPGSVDDLRRTLLPGESYTTQFVIDVPTAATGLRFLLASGDWETKLMIGHENAWLHGKTTFRMGGGS